MVSSPEDEAREESIEASDRLSSDDASSKGAAEGAEVGEGGKAGDGSGGKAGDARSGCSGESPTAGKGAEGTCTGKSGRGTEVPRARGCNGRKPERMWLTT